MSSTSDNPSETAVWPFTRHLAVLVGIDAYPIEGWRLKTPVADVTTIGGILEEKHNFKVQLLRNEQATLAGLRECVTDLQARAGTEARVIFYFAGHGIALPGADGLEGYILPFDARKDEDPEDNFMSMRELHELLSKLTCRHLLVVLDCCFSGAYRWSSSRNLVLSPGTLDKERFKWFVEGRAWQAIASAAHDEKAVDVAFNQPLGMRDDSEIHSPFALAMIEGLKGAADLALRGGSPDGVITATELFLHIERALQDERGGRLLRQKPVQWPLATHESGQFVFLTPGTTLDLQPPPPLDPAANPWRRLQPYEPEDKDIFFGRGQVSEDLAERILRDPLVIVTGASGIGKSSLVRAGLLWRAEAHGMTPIVMRPGPRPFAALAAALQTKELAGVEVPTADQLDSDACDALATMVSKLSEDRQILLVIDQAEELITQNNDAKTQKRFLALIANALDASQERPATKNRFTKERAKSAIEALGYTSIGDLTSVAGTWRASAIRRDTTSVVTVSSSVRPLRAVLTVRAEFERHFAKSPLGNLWSDARRLVPPMTQDEFRRVIEGPAAVRSMRFESEDLVNRLINEVIEMPGALPVLSFALSEMYEHYVKAPQTDRSLTFAHYEALQGGASGSLTVRADKMVATVNENVARMVLERFVSIGGGAFARRRVPMDEFVQASTDDALLVDSFITKLRDAYLVVSDKVGDEEVLELAHDILILGWSRLVEWVRADAAMITVLRQLTLNAAEWQESDKRKSGLLWSDKTRYANLKKLLTIKSLKLNAEESKFAAASRTQATIKTFAQFAAVAIPIAFLAGIAWVQGERATFAKQREVASIARSWIANGNPGTAASYIAEAASANPNVGSDELRWAFLNSLHSTIESQITRHDGEFRTFTQLKIDDNGTAAAFTLHGAQIFEAGRLGSPIQIVGSSKEIVTGDFSRSSEFVALAGNDGKIGVWQWRTSTSPWRTIEMAKSAKVVLFDNNAMRLLTLDNEGRGCVWTLADPDLVACPITISDTAGRLNDLAWNSDGSQLIGVGDDGLLSVWSPDTGERIGERIALNTPPPPGLNWRIVVAPKLERAATWVDEPKNKQQKEVAGALFALDTRKTVGSIESSEERWIGGIAFSPAGDRFIVRTRNTARLVDSEFGRVIGHLFGHRGYIRDAQFSGDGKQLVTASYDRSVRVWDGTTGHPRYVLKGHDDRAWKAIFSADACSVISMSEDKTLRIWPIAADAWQRRISENPCDGRTIASASKSLNSASFDRQGNLLATASNDKRARVWFIKSGEQAPPLPQQEQPVLATAFHPKNNQLLAVGSGYLENPKKPSMLRLYDWQTSKELSSVEVKGRVRSLAFDPDGRYLLAAAGNGEALVLKLTPDNKLKPFIPLPHGTLPIVSAAWSRDGKYVATAATDNLLRIWAIESAGASPAKACYPLSDKVFAVAWGHRSNRLAAVDGHGNIFLWEDGTINAPKPKPVFLSDGRYAFEAQFTHDDKALVLRLDDGAVIVWDIDLNREVYELYSPIVATGIAQSSDGSMMATAHKDGSARVFRLGGTLDELIDMAKIGLPRCMSDNERSRYGKASANASVEWCADKWPRNDHVQTFAARPWGAN